jgi:hypothetical protein
MQLISGPLGTILVAGLAAAGLLSWLARDRRYPGPRLVGKEPPIDREALERAEAEVRALEPAPDQLMLREEWRPGVPRPPERL